MLPFTTPVRVEVWAVMAHAEPAEATAPEGEPVAANVNLPSAKLAYAFMPGRAWLEPLFLIHRPALLISVSWNPWGTTRLEPSR